MSLLYMLFKSPSIESVNDIFTSVFDLEHSRHRNPDNALTHMISAICAYAPIVFIRKNHR
ncbi:hypothetical protein [Chryseobacterium mucoviscidosis]|uniref:hypothetical protein n=1 Tax=Chryseobacterium mucoviscidosis TaxID=1945581 RepID=UPI000F4FE3A6|nr:hypothetical protein [Chryseobacterium mucoviscidosis]